MVYIQDLACNQLLLVQVILTACQYPDSVFIWDMASSPGALGFTKEKISIKLIFSK